MIGLGIAVIFAAVLAGLSVRPNARFRHHQRLPMQWSLDGTVNWTAPRALAVSFVPALAIIPLMLVTLVRPRAGPEAIVLPVTILMGMTFVAIQLFHFWLFDRTLNRNGR